MDIQNLDTGIDLSPKNKAKNILEVNKRKIILDSKPRMLAVIITNRCNLNCIMCNSRHKEGTTLEKSVVEEILKMLPYLKRMNWQGGEIFYVNYLKEIFRELIPYRNLNHEIFTNGLLLDQEWIEILLKLDVTLRFSIDGMTQESYNYIRRGGKFTTLVKNIELLNKLEDRVGNNLERTINVVVMKSNYKELDKFVDFAKKYRFRKIVFKPVKFLTNEENIFHNMSLGVSNDLVRVTNKVKERALTKGVGVFFDHPVFDIDLPGSNIESDKKTVKEDEEASIYDKQGLYCVNPWKTLWIDVTRGGNVYPACECKHPVGNIYKDDLLEIWNNEKMKDYRKNIVTGNKELCRGCIEIEKYK